MGMKVRGGQLWRARAGGGIRTLRSAARAAWARCACLSCSRHSSTASACAVRVETISCSQQ